MSEPKQLHELPQEVFDAVKEADFQALRRYRESLDGDEVIRACDTAPIFEWMVSNFKEPTAQERLDIQEVRETLAKLQAAQATRKVSHILMELERVAHEQWQRMLAKKSPALYMMGKMMRGEAPPGPDTLRVADGQWRAKSIFSII